MNARRRRDLLLQEVGKKAAQVSQKMQNGAAACDVEQELRDKIYLPFDFKFEVGISRRLANNRTT